MAQVNNHYETVAKIAVDTTADFTSLVLVDSCSWYKSEHDIVGELIVLRDFVERWNVSWTEAFAKLMTSGIVLTRLQIPDISFAFRVTSSDGIQIPALLTLSNQAGATFALLHMLPETEEVETEDENLYHVVLCYKNVGDQYIVTRHVNGACKTLEDAYAVWDSTLANSWFWRGIVSHRTLVERQFPGYVVSDVFDIDNELAARGYRVYESETSDSNIINEES